LGGGATKVVNAHQQEKDNRTIQRFMVKHGDNSLEEFAPAINRLELSAATMVVSLAERFADASGLDITKFRFWTDSENVIRQINRGGNSAFITKYNYNRVAKILSKTSPSQWRHVDGKRNPADVASRGTPRAEEFLSSKLWLQGPDFLTQTEDKWPTQN
jgi:isoleucyl-tRNA synthetase